jgi:hypothetical protein
MTQPTSFDLPKMMIGVGGAEPMEANSFRRRHSIRTIEAKTKDGKPIYIRVWAESNDSDDKHLAEKPVDVEGVRLIKELVALDSKGVDIKSLPLPRLHVLRRDDLDAFFLKCVDPERSGAAEAFGLIKEMVALTAEPTGDLAPPREPVLDIRSILSSACSANAERRFGVEPAGSPSCVPTPASVESIDFSYGVMDILLVVCSSLIGHGVIEPAAFQLDCERYVALWRSEGREARAVAAEVFLGWLKKIEADKRERPRGRSTSTKDAL